MNHSVLLPFQFLLILLTAHACNNTTTKNQSEIKVLVVAGGHAFDTSEFVGLFETMNTISFDTLMQPRANQKIAEGLVSDYDVIVFYDMWPNLDSAEKAGYSDLFELGKGFVFLHHSLCSYQNWDQFSEIVGGRYYTEWSDVTDSMLSSFKHDIEIDVEIANTKHPIVEGVKDFRIHDEGYDNIQVNGDVEVLFTSSHPDCSNTLGWVNTYDNSTVVYLMLGHDSKAYENANFQRILENSIHFVVPSI